MAHANYGPDGHSVGSLAGVQPGSEDYLSGGTDHDSYAKEKKQDQHEIRFLFHYWSLSINLVLCLLANPDPAGQDIEVRCYNQGPNRGVNREVLLPEEECLLTWIGKSVTNNTFFCDDGMKTNVMWHGLELYLLAGKC